MDRRGVFKGALTALAGWIGTARAAGVEDRAPMKVVYHLSEFEKVDSVLTNIRHHYEAVGGTEKATIALVAHGSAVRAFRRDGSAATLERLGALQRRGLSPFLCAVALRGQNIAEADLAPGLHITESGVVRLCELQREGYLYLRP
jgi:intracellular sulfur oxidation DsrE/DsrF family protein